MEVRGEVLMITTQFEHANEARTTHAGQPFANPRNAAAGTLRATDRLHTVPMTFFGYGLLPLADTEPEIAALLGERAHSDLFALAVKLGVDATAHTAVPGITATTTEASWPGGRRSQPCGPSCRSGSTTSSSPPAVLNAFGRGRPGPDAFRACLIPDLNAVEPAPRPALFRPSVPDTRSRSRTTGATSRPAAVARRHRTSRLPSVRALVAAWRAVSGRAMLRPAGRNSQLRGANPATAPRAAAAAGGSPTRSMQSPTPGHRGTRRPRAAAGPVAGLPTTGRGRRTPRPGRW